MGKTTQRARQQQVRAGQHPMWARQQRVRARQHSDNTQMGARQPQRARQHSCGGKTTHNGGRTTQEHNPNWEEVSGNCDVNKSFSHLYKTINHVVNKHAPLRDASVRKLKMLTKPWLTAGLRKSIKVKNKLFFESNWPKYKIYRNKLTTLIRLSKQRHYQRFFDSNIKKYAIDMERY